MYEHQGLQDIFYLMLYGGAAMLAVAACCYLLLRRGNAFWPAIHPPRELRFWGAAFLASVALSHVWWVVLGIHWLADDRVLRNAVAEVLDTVTLVALMMAFLTRMLQDRRRPLWPIIVAIAPIVAISIIGVVMRTPLAEKVMRGWVLFVAFTFTLYLVGAVRQYGRWLHQNYADLEHKEVWQSLLFLVCILLMYMTYNLNYGSIAMEYLTQVCTLVIIVFILWRVESLQKLDTDEVTTPTTEVATDASSATALPQNIGTLLKQHCEDKQLYLQHDLTLAQLSLAVGTNRTYLSTYFAQQGITYNNYINQLRIQHFISLFREAAAASRHVTALELAQQCGYHSYSTFSTAFKQFVGLTPKAWLKQEGMS